MLFLTLFTCVSGILALFFIYIALFVPLHNSIISIFLNMQTTAHVNIPLYAITRAIVDNLQSFQASEASEHASVQSSQLVSCQQQLQNSTSSIEHTLANVPQLVVAQVAAGRDDEITDVAVFHI